ncbi:MAG: glycosyltransferase family 2 protein [Pseudomonadota bacterium]|nr:glycosyltransferase family 2 protein [Pseudomonadota bacterium]
MTTASTPGKVAIWLATRNGAGFLDQQLRSLAAQTHPSIDIWASDDGSTDRTPAILADWQGRWNKGAFVVSQGPREGFAENFRALIANPSTEADFFACCDQDDLWEQHKLETALAWMRGEDGSQPLLFCSRTLTISESGEPIGLSPLFSRKPSFRNALVQSLAGGNTMVLNRAAREVVALASQRTRFVSHDWWMYQVVTGVGGTVRYSPEPLVRYRQHANNLVGANTSWAARRGRLRRLLGGQLAEWNEINLAALEKNRDLLTADAITALELFSRARKENLLKATASLTRSGVYRQTPQGTLTLWAALALGLM